MYVRSENERSVAGTRRGRECGNECGEGGYYHLRHYLPNSFLFHKLEV